jgi:hypothetical protein
MFIYLKISTRANFGRNSGVGALTRNRTWNYSLGENRDVHFTIRALELHDRIELSSQRYEGWVIPLYERSKAGAPCRTRTDLNLLTREGITSNVYGAIGGPTKIRTLINR